MQAFHDGGSYQSFFIMEWSIFHHYIYSYKLNKTIKKQKQKGMYICICIFLILGAD